VVQSDIRPRDEMLNGQRPVGVAEIANRILAVKSQLGAWRLKQGKERKVPSPLNISQGEI
jgi:hypothetical protein